MTKFTNLTNECLAIGSLPHKSVNETMGIVKTYYNTIPFCPQLPKLSPNITPIVFIDEPTVSQIGTSKWA